jgi:hypothetical protein
MMYEVTLGPAAIRMILNLSLTDRKQLGDALQTELVDGPNAASETRFDGNAQICRGQGPLVPDLVYTGTPLSFDGYIAVHRPMTRTELDRLRDEQGREVAGHGVHVLDILPADWPFTRGSWLLPGAS